MTPSSDWTQWAKGTAPPAPGTSPAGSGSTSPAGSGGDWTQWAGGGEKPPVPAGTSPFPYTVRCPIGPDSSAARVTLPSEAGAGTTFLTDVGVEGSGDGALPSPRGYEVPDPATVLVHLTGDGDVTTGPEYEPAPYPGGKKKAVPPAAGQPFVTVLVVPPPFDY
ncbi:hypothetical protein ABZX30_02860 [Streptomyces sp. NPDC004542]|uniref:hypothetical protein n=1 Tax=Streptomyces sp. NPDC004542 TaxID=3154281 RepID=UPI0033B178FE